MKFIGRMAVSMMVIFFFIGCATTDRPVQTKEVNSVSLKEPNPYYYYTESQIFQRRGDLDRAIYFLNKAIETDSESLFLLNELAEMYLQSNKTPMALEMIERILQQDEYDIRALTIYGRIKHDLKEYNSAISTYEKILKKNPDQENIYLFLGGIYQEIGDQENAMRIYHRLVQEIPESYAGHFYLGKLYLEQGLPENAEQQFKRTLDLAPDLEEPRYELIQLYKQQGMMEKALQVYEDLLALNPENVRTAFEVGLFYRTIDQTDHSDAIFRQLGMQSEENPDILQVVARDYLETKAFDDALVILKGMLEGAPDNSDLNYLTAIALDSLGAKEKAIFHFKKVLQSSQFYENALIQISLLYQELGQIDMAIAFLLEVIETHSDNLNPALLLNLGSLYEEADHLAKAEEVLIKGLVLDPDNVWIHFRLGVVYDKQGKKDASIKRMKRVIVLDPKHAHALNYLGYTYAESGQNLDEAEQLIREALKYRPEDGYITDSLGWVYFQKGLYEEALETLKKAVELVPDDPVILEHLGDAYRKMNDKYKALEYYQRSLTNKKNNTTELEQKIKTLTREIEMWHTE